MLLDMSVREMFCAFPGISRSQHIGQYNGTHMPAERFELLQAKAVHDGSTQQFVALGGDS
jgi:hypothetical protein